MAVNRLTNYERETVINYNADDKTASVFTWDHRLQAALESLPEAKVLAKGMHQHPEDHYVHFEVPKSWVKVKPPKYVSPGSRKAAGDRFRALAAARRIQATPGMPRVALGRRDITGVGGCLDTPGASEGQKSHETMAAGSG